MDGPDGSFRATTLRPLGCSLCHGLKERQVTTQCLSLLGGRLLEKKEGLQFRLHISLQQSLQQSLQKSHLKTSSLWIQNLSTRNFW